MCRIAGIVDLDQPKMMSCIEMMRDSMRHGGPDDAGVFSDPDLPLVLGVRRLSLIDLSERGHQPMCSADGRYVIAFNGEVYNFRELRRELEQMGHVFFSHTDTEVVLHAYLQWGTAAFNRLNGMFALALWDKPRGHLQLVRDHAGMKPLYYHLNEQKGRLYFASEIRAFRAMNPGWEEDEQWRARFLAFGFVPEPGTTLKGVKALPKGHMLTFDVRGRAAGISKWYSPWNTTPIANATEARAAIAACLSDAVESHLVADAPIGAFLSGGTDSSLITLLAARSGISKLNTLSIDFEETGFSERPYQDLVVNQAGSAHRRFMVTQRDFEEALPDLLTSFDMPSTDGINSYFISRYAREAGLKAVLSGVGSDELFGGYPGFRRRRWVIPLRMLGPLLHLGEWLPGDRIRRLTYLSPASDRAEYLFYRGFFTPRQIADILQMSLHQVLDALQLHEQNAAMLPARGMARVSQMEQDIYMQNQLLRDTDYMSMWHSVEVRLPFLDRRMMELCSRIHPAVRFYGKRPKQLLTDAFPQLLPRAIWDRKKMGFTFPLGKWMEGVSINGAVHPRLFRYRSLLQSGHMQWSRYWAYLLSTGQPVTTRPASKRILFAALKIFSATGGIEKFNRSFAKALAENAISHGWQVTIASAYDKAAHNLYFPTAGFAGFASKRLRFTRTMLQWTRHYDTCIIGHINLSVIVAAGKMANPNCRFILIAHGIEMWKPLPWIQRTALHECRQIWSVSQFTRSNILQHNRIDADRISIFPNTIDPYFVQAKSREDVNILRQQLGIQQQSQIVLTVARLATTEQYKGYDHVFHVLPALRRQFPQLIYILAGTGDKQELSRLKQMASELEISDAVLFTGFVPDDQLPLYYALADVFAMPSRKEGFGIVFLEAAYTGLRVVAGNADGSPEALLQGQLGSLIAPDDEDALVRTISEYLTQPPLTPEAGEAQRQLIESHFGFRVFKNRQAKMLEQL